MKRVVAFGLLTAVAGLPSLAHAEASGSHMQAGGGFMSSFVADPYHDPRSLHSQRAGTGQILGAPMLSENAGAKGVPAGTIRVGVAGPEARPDAKAQRQPR